jgi:predicted GIY-YIG superfamily endonuclease
MYLLSTGVNMCVVYWIRTKKVTDINDGYIGVTSKTPQKRLEEHNKKGRFCFYGKKEDLIIETLFEGSEEECFAKEKELRPSERIGWNIAPGGEGGYKGNHFVRANGMPWNKKAQEKRRQMIKEGKIKVKGSTDPEVLKEAGKRLKRRAPWQYTIKDKYTGKLHTVFGREGISKIIDSAPVGSKINKFLYGQNDQFELLNKTPRFKD